MKFRIYISVLIIFLCLDSLGQSVIGKYSIKGALISKNNKITLGNTSIILLNTNTGEKQFSACDPWGNFYIDNLLKGNYTLRTFDEDVHVIDSVIILKNKSLNKLKVYCNVECRRYHVAKAEDDLREGHPKLLLIGSIAPAIYLNQNIFEKKYGVEYYDFGCTPEDEDDCLVSYDKVIFNHLDSTYGKKWRKEVRRDVIGFRKDWYFRHFKPSLF